MDAITFKGTCDLCKSSDKLLKNLPKETAKTLGHTYGLNIQNPAVWRICAQCNYEICNVIQKYLETTTTNSHPALSPDLTKCFVCGNRKVVKNHSLREVVIKIRDTGLAVPLGSCGEIYACFSCHFIVETVVKYKEILQSSQMWQTYIRSYKNLTETINTAKRSSTTTVSSSSTNRVRNRKNARPVKLQPPVKKCIVTLQKLDFSSLGEQLALSTTSNPKKSEEKTVRLHQGDSWEKCGLTNGLSPLRPKPVKTPKRRVSSVIVAPVITEVIDRGYQTDTTNAGRISRKRKHVNNKDFIYFSHKDSLETIINNSKKIKGPKPPPKPTKKPKIPVTKPCYVKLTQIPEAKEKEEIAIVEKVSYESPTTDFTTSVKEILKENSTPNIPRIELKAKEHEISPSSSMDNLLVVDVVSPVKSILNSPRNNNLISTPKSVSFAADDDFMVYTPEESLSEAPEITNEIDIQELDDYLSHDPQRSDDSEPENETDSEVNKAIHEIISEQFESPV